MDILWLGVFALLLIGYFALEGFDIGIGMLLPVLGRTREERDRLVAGMAPFVLAGEVWLVAVAGVLFGAFPHLEGETLFALYPLVVGLLVSWVIRDAGLWFRRRLDGRAWRAFWGGALCAGSYGLALTWGLALAALVQGGPVLTPLGVGYAAVVVGVFAIHGRRFAAWRAGGPGRTGRALLGSAALAAVPVAVPLAVAAPWLLDHVAPSGTLRVLTLVILPCVPVMVAAQVWVWRAFGRRARAGVGARVPSFF
ncbi:cytochrome d ubiquinol oxidase subunit II [Microtetraspora fusca]|uniref:cytochrome d ubiquinol oxidase subunit II n=1 Tax=Microtetraspora fusca TaxID=1997 RepID=UPI000833AAA6|nr:cytochrome d ubiquinol oxidase subunit II [Microtetraspora fusca]